MEDTISTVSSELYQEQNCTIDKIPEFENNAVSVYKFCIPQKAQHDSDGDLIVTKKTENIYKIELEHSKSTILKQVGEQLWRGAFVLADWIIFNSEFVAKSEKVLELATGVGLTGIVASMYTPIILTDINSGNLLNLIRANVKKNRNISQHSVEVCELDFTKEFAAEINNILPKVDIVLAADVIYDNDLTEEFVKTLSKIIAKNKKCKIFVALEKRYVFTMADFETCAPCIEYFKDYIKSKRDLKIRELSIDFPQYFQYERVKELVLYEITSN